ncbi:MAG: bifunctional adenosylcobinamide kinase/adenosylcobinamide-phosphate guanylyltransferase [Firmicutes bacterium]|nr:bifunctional adenosylcobinamide kinase/adenosylcobinamide-phosphate guanylyltransferase [Bacillota bacterium]
MTIFIIGGVKSRKSDYAQQLALRLAGAQPHFYIATMLPHDEEDYARIRSHLARRAGMGFQTLEWGRHLLENLAASGLDGTFLLDSATALLSNELFPPERDYAPDEGAAARCVRDLSSFVERVRNAVIVCDDIFSDAGRYDAITELYRRYLGEICQQMGARCDTVVEMLSGYPIIRKGRLPE